MKIYTDLEQKSEEWFKVRIGKITGSNIYKLFMGENTKGRKEYIETLTAEHITNHLSDTSFSNIHIRRGVDLEDDALFYYMMLNECDVKKVGFVELNKYVGYSPDGFVEDDGLIEIKNKDTHTFFRYLKTNKIETNHIYQMQFGLYVTNRKWCDYVCYNPYFKEKPISIQRIKRDEEIIKLLETTIEQTINEIETNIYFYKSHLKKCLA